MMHGLHWRAGRQAAHRIYSIAHKLKRTENVLNRNEMRETELEVLLCKQIIMRELET